MIGIGLIAIPMANGSTSLIPWPMAGSVRAVRASVARRLDHEHRHRRMVQHLVGRRAEQRSDDRPVPVARRPRASARRAAARHRDQRVDRSAVDELRLHVDRRVDRERGSARASSSMRLAASPRPRARTSPVTPPTGFCAVTRTRSRAARRTRAASSTACGQRRAGAVRPVVPEHDVTGHQSSTSSVAPTPSAWSSGTSSRIGPCSLIGGAGGPVPSGSGRGNGSRLRRKNVGRLHPPEEHERDPEQQQPDADHERQARCRTARRTTRCPCTRSIAALYEDPGEDRRAEERRDADEEEVLDALEQRLAEVDHARVAR